MRSRISRMLPGTVLAAMATTLLIGCDKMPDHALHRPAASIVSDTTAEMGVNTKAAFTSRATTVNDAAVTGRVKTALLVEQGITSLDISVRTLNGEIQLTGFVDDQGQLDQVTQIARTTEGAGSVKNKLRIKQ